jgi:hypothetical protein
MNARLATGALCAAHPELTAVDLCARCGSFLCGECVDFADEQTYCAACLALVTDRASRPARLSVVVSTLGVLGMLSGLVVSGRAGLVIWAAAIPTGFVGFALAVQTLRNAPTQASRRWARTARAIAGLHGFLVIALAVSFFAFLLLRRG